MKNRILKSIVWWVSTIYLLGLVFLWTATYWPREWWWLANVFQIAPLWILGIPVLFLFLVAMIVRVKSAFLINGVSSLIIVGGIMGFNVPVHFDLKPEDASSPTIRIMSINMDMGGRVKFDQLIKYINRVQPDLIAFQELSSPVEDSVRMALSMKQWDLKAEGHLGLASRFRIKDMKVKDRRNLGGWGGMIAKFEIETPLGNFFFFDTHLETPREGVEALMRFRLHGIRQMQKVTEIQEKESAASSPWVVSLLILLFCRIF